jgi:hypothetical protein
MRSINQLRRITKLIISLREKSDASLIFARSSEIAAPVYNFILYFYIVDNFFYQWIYDSDILLSSSKLIS